MPLVQITVGISGSGKSSWAEDEVQKSERPIHNSNRDDIRFKEIVGTGIRDWSKYKFSKKNEQEVTRIQQERIENAIKHGTDIIVSDTNLNPIFRNKLVEQFENNGYDVELVPFPITWETAVKRNAQREGGVSQTILWNQFMSMNSFMGRRVHEPKNKSEPAVIIDIDGTVARMNERSPFEWDKVNTDHPRKEIISMVDGVIEDGLTPVFLSGRDGTCRDLTYEWIMEHIMFKWCGAGEGFHLFMRDVGDMRNDYIVKEELFFKYVNHNFDVKVAIDDRPRVVRLWHELRIPSVVSVANQMVDF